MVFLYLDVTTEPFSNLRVRQALSHAIDRDLMVKVAMYTPNPLTPPVFLKV